ncbi:adenylate kinase [Flexivirga sp. B27]
MSRADVSDLKSAHRLLLYGVTGSGKSTAAERVSVALGLPCHLVDEEIGWLPGWVERDRAAQREIASRIVAGECWVLDSAYGHWRDVVLPRVDVVVALDYPRWLSLGRLVRRTTRRVVTRRPACNGNIETIGKVLSPDSILVWHFRSFAAKRQRIAEWSAEPAGPRVLRVTHPRELDDLVTALGR